MLGEQISHRPLPARRSTASPGAGIEIVQHYRRSAMSICEAGMPRVSMGSILSNAAHWDLERGFRWPAARLINSSRVSFASPA